MTALLEHGDLLGERGAEFSVCGRYRYSLWRKWGDEPLVLFVMLNPSTADATQDDPTIRRTISFARAWGAGGVRICNLYAWRSTDPKCLLDAPDVVGEPGGILNRNDAAIIASAGDAGRIIAAWGAWPGPVSLRPARMLALLARPGRTIEALALTKHGQPRHPLYVRGDVDPIPYGGAR